MADTSSEQTTQTSMGYMFRGTTGSKRAVKWLRIRFRCIVDSHTQFQVVPCMQTH